MFRRLGLVRGVLALSRESDCASREDARLATVVPAHRPFLSFHRDRVFIRHDSEE
jgi:hypothetical protein